jgi:hypothetical protein
MTAPAYETHLRAEERSATTGGTARAHRTACGQIRATDLANRPQETTCPRCLVAWDAALSEVGEDYTPEAMEAALLRLAVPR